VVALTDSLRSTKWLSLFRDALVRFTLSDGFSHARALAFQMALVAMPALIAAVGLTTSLDQESLRSIARETLTTLSPGEADNTITKAFEQGTEASGDLAVWLGLGAALVTATAAMGQLERGMNRIYGIDRDRPFIAKYTRALVLSVTAGVLLVIAFVLFIAGTAIGEAGVAVAGWDEAVASTWSIVRWPLMLLLLAGSLSLLFRYVPREKRPTTTWPGIGSAVALIAWLLCTGLLAVYMEASKGFGAVYGPLAGMIGLLLWAYLSSIAILFGVACAAQLEAEHRLA
jgi:YihY family inner membrane protein